jgi:hypothetical protein
MSEDQSAGASYLAALKRSGPAGAAPARAPEDHAGNLAPPAAGPSPSEKRRSPRYRCQGSARLHEITSGVATWATFTDISMHGCYVEAMSTFHIGAELALTIEVNGHRVECRGSVRVVYPGLGMGISFTSIPGEYSERLRELLRSLSQPSVILGTRPGLDRASPLPPPETTSAVTDPAAVLRAITLFFEERHMLGRDEFLRILRKSQQSRR